MRKSRVQRTPTRAGFTMIELMVVLAVIGILVMGMFRLMGVTSGKAKESETIATLERVKNALSGYYAIYGCYPPVKNIYAPLDPSSTTVSEYCDTESSGRITKDGDAALASFVARAQPLAFEFPNKKDEESYINSKMAPRMASSARSPELTTTDWRECKMFKFGLMSFLLPRVEMMVSRDDNSSGQQIRWAEQNSLAVPYSFFETAQWAQANMPAPRVGSNDQEKQAILKKQLAVENDACAKWLPNFEGRVSLGSVDLLLGVNIRRKHAGDMYACYDGSSGGVVLMKITMIDGWGNELYYYSEPPYQSYRLWSAGPDGFTFPPWLDTDQYRSGTFAKCREWMADDVVSFDR